MLSQVPEVTLLIVLIKISLFNRFYIFGGEDIKEKEYNDFWSFDFEKSLKWNQEVFKGYLPSCII